MKTVKIEFVLLLLSLMAWSAVCRADDTDLFLVNAAVAQQRPNVLIILDNTANWNQPFEFEKAALVSVVSGLTDQFNVGLMLFTETGNGNPNPDGAYVRFAIRQMTADAGGIIGSRSRLAALVNNLDVLNDKSNGGKAGITMYEAWLYYAGLASYSGGPPGESNGKVKSDNGSVYIGTNPVSMGDSGAFVSRTGVYNTPKASGCQNNFIIYISNGPVQDNAADTSDATAWLAGLGGNTAEMLLDPNGSQSNIADEYTRFFSTVNTTTGLFNIVTYTVDVLPGSTGQGPGWTANLKNMAQQGKGKYFVGTDAVTLTNALKSIFNEVMAVNSVFSSSTLPVNVSVRGTHLNQVYMAVFRPDAHLSPRWTGNLKQYKLGYSAVTETTFLTDKNGLAAENTISGFVSPLATSVWTTASSFWASPYYYDAQGYGATPTSDAPDGAFVEKGGAAQHVRSGYTYNTGSSQPNRSIYTCTGSCTAGSALSSYLFANSNSDIALADLGLVSYQKSITSLTHPDNLATSATVTVTATTSSSHQYTDGQLITISGANQPGYNGSFGIHVSTGDTTHFTYDITETPVTPATVVLGSTNMVATKPLQEANLHEVYSITHNGAVPTATVTVTMPDDSWFRAYCNNFSYCSSALPTSIEITGAKQTQYNGTHTATWLNSTHFTFTVSSENVLETPVQPTSYGTSTPGTPVSGCTSYANDSMTRSGNTVTVMLPAHGNNPTTLAKCFSVNNTTTITSATPTDYNITATITTADIEAGNGNDKNKMYVNSYTFDLPAGTVLPAHIEPLSPATLAKSTMPIQVANTAYVNKVNVSSLTRINGTATVTTATAHGFADDSEVCIVHAAQSQYNVCAHIDRTGTTTFTYPVAYSPISPATGTIIATDPTVSGLSKQDLINWVRAQNTQQNDNPTGNTTTVRGYLHGDVLHSRPAIINYNRTGQSAGRDIMAYYGANDGIFHAVKGGDDDTDGYEKWGFVPVEHFGKFKRLYQMSPLIGTANPKPYFTDGSVGYYTYDANNDGQLTTGLSNDKAYVFLSMRRGGRFYYALDVIDPDAPKFLWKKTNTSTGYAELGMTWSEPKAGNIRYQSGPVLVFGLGYDATANDVTTPGTATMGRGIMVADAVTGTPIWQAGPNPTGAAYNKTVTEMIYSIVADTVVLDTDSNGYADRIYAADTGGNIWRVNIDDASPSNWTVYKVASIGGSNANARKFLYAPDVVYSSGYDAILIGSGDREHPSDTTVLNRFYMFKDSHSLNAIRPLLSDTSRSTLVESDLYNATANLVQVGTSAQQTAAVAGYNAASGWYVTLGKWDNTSSSYLPIGEKVVGGSISMGGATYFATNVPAVSLGNTNACSSNLGESRLYAVNFKTGAAILDLYKSVSSSPSDTSSTTPTTALTTEDRYMIQPGGGFAPSPVAAVVELSGQPRESVIIGTSVMQTPRQDLNRRHSIYWGIQID